MYNWTIAQQYYTEKSEEHGPKLMQSEEFNAYVLQNLSSIVRITRDISRSPMWSGIQVKNGSRSNLIDQIATMFMGLTLPLKLQREITLEINEIDLAVSHYNQMDKEEIYLAVSQTMQDVLPNINDVLSEFHSVVINSQELSYIDVIKVMLLTGLFLGNAIIHTKQRPDGEVKNETNIFFEYVDYLMSVIQRGQE